MKELEKQNFKTPQYSIEETKEMVKNWYEAKEKNKDDFKPIII